MLGLNRQIPENGYYYLTKSYPATTLMSAGDVIAGKLLCILANVNVDELNLLWLDVDAASLVDALSLSVGTGRSLIDCGA